MSWGGDDRGQSVVIGAVILFGFLVIAMSTYQATVVPQQNSQAEFTHEQTVRNDLVGVRDAVVTTGTTGETIPASVKLGTRFPDRTLFVNPPPAVGRLETRDGGNVTLNVSRADFSANVPEPNETEDGWPTAAAERFGENDTFGNYTTKTLVYTPQYRAYGGGPANITLESSRVLARYDDGTTVNLTQSPLLVSGDQVTLFLLKGNLSEAGVDDVTLEPTAVSSVSDRVRVSNFEVTVPTALSAGGFETVLTRGNQVDDDDVVVTENTTRRAVDVRFPGEYELAVAAVSVGRHDEERTASSVEFTAVERNVTEGESARVVVRVRDQYGNAMPSATVTANASAFDGDVQQTDSTGRTAFEFNTSGVSSEVRVNVTVNESVAPATGTGPFDQSTAENATANVTVVSPEPGPGPSPGNPGAWPLNWDAPDELTANSGVGFSDCSDESCTVDAWNVSELVVEVGTGGETNGAAVTFATNNSTVATIDPTTTTTDTDGNATGTVTLRRNGTAQLVAISGGRTDNLTLQVTNQSIRYRQDAVTARDGGVRFNVTNYGGADRTVTDIRLAPVDDAVARLDDPSGNEGEFESEFYVEVGGRARTADFGGGKSLPTTFDLSEASVQDDEHTIRGGETAEYSLYQFQDSDGNPIGMDGRRTVVELFFEDGGSREFVIVPEPGASGDRIRYNRDATTVGDGPGNSDKSGVEFSVENVGSESATVTDIRIEPENSDIDEFGDSSVDEGKFESEFYVEVGGRTNTTDFGGTAPLPGDFDLSEASNQDEEHLIRGGETATYTLYQFRESGGFGSSEANMQNEDVTVTLRFADGSSVTFTLTP
ncbi:hypothetical protein [Halobaculum sp. MBLA0143]|uniref:hypothetical protein n=1 Tax=Halobaculum sp. MBLA0143 TaxID=3079933 RepID=UPI003526A47F